MKALPQDKFERIGSTHLLNLAFAGGGFRDPKLDGWAKVFVRQVDMATEEYAHAQYQADQHGQTADLQGAIFFTLATAGDRLELCLICMRRALRCLDRLTGAGGITDRSMRRRVTQLGKAIVAVRDEIEHIEEAIAKGLDSVQPHTLRISDDRQTAMIGNQTIRIDDIVLCLTILRKVAHEVATQRSATPPESGGPVLS